METGEEVFKTKSGYCHVLDDKLVLTRDGPIGDLAQLTTGDNIYRLIITHVLLTLVLIYLIYRNYQKEEWFSLTVFSAAALFMIYSIITSLNKSATGEIMRDRISKITFQPEKKGITRAYFKVHFKDNNGKMKIRLIMLPGSLSGGKEEAEKALNIMRNAGLMT